MATTDQEARATQLAKEAVELVTAGKTEVLKLFIWSSAVAD